MNLLRTVRICVGILTTVGTLATAQRVHADPALTGIFVGSMHLTDGKVRDIPLALSLIQTDEPLDNPGPGGQTNVIDGTCVIDEEGGPYTFIRVTYDIVNNRLDMKYSRPRNDPSSTSPASFRLIGALDNEEGISGTVSSGIVGPIGTFKVKQNQNLSALPMRTKYTGRWIGGGDVISTGERKTVEIRVQPSGTASTNPPTFEFDFTPGRVSGYSYNGIPVVSFSLTSIDYLRRKMVLTNSSDGVSIEANIVQDGRFLQGEQSSQMWGRTIIFQGLRRVE